MRNLINRVVIFQVDLSPELPNRICDTCSKSVRDAFSFRLQCRTSEQALLGFFNKTLKEANSSSLGAESIKEEIPDDSNLAEEYLDEAFQTNDINNEEDDFRTIRVESLAPEVVLDHFDIKHPTTFRSPYTKLKEPDEVVSSKVGIPAVNPVRHKKGETKKRKPFNLKLDPSEIVAVEDFEQIFNKKSQIAKVEHNPGVIIETPSDVNRSNPIVCCQCDYLTHSMKDLIRHYSIAHSNIVNGIKSDHTVQCPLCYQTFSSEEELRAIHLRKEINMTCRFCNVTYTQRIKFREHLETHEEHRFLCTECGKEYKHYNGFISHVIQHRNAFKFLCPECGKQFGRKTELDVHMACHVEKSFQCDLCGTKVARRATLMKHMRTHTGEKR